MTHLLTLDERTLRILHEECVVWLSEFEAVEREFAEQAARDEWSRIFFDDMIAVKENLARFVGALKSYNLTV